MMTVDIFKDDFFWMLRESAGYFPWIQDESYRLARHLWWRDHHLPHWAWRLPSPREIIRAVVEEEVCENPLFDLAMKALIRAEIRFSSRFIPQQSHEERLTGNLVSEIDSAIFLVRDQFRKTSLELYSIEKEIDFLYCDLSKGGKLERATGADLGIILVVDLPDFPYTVKSLILQAKKMSANSANIETQQFDSLAKNGAKGGSAYLFYDMMLSRRCSPLVVSIEGPQMRRRYEECAKKNGKSFNFSFDDACSGGLPLSLLLTSDLAYDEAAGCGHRTFKDAYSMFSQLADRRRGRADDAQADFNGRLAIVSIGRRIQFSTPENEAFDVAV